MSSRRHRGTALRLGGVAIAAAMWQLASAVVPAGTALPSFTATVSRLAQLTTTHGFWNDAAGTFTQAALGFVIAASVGVTVGLAAGLSSLVAKSLTVVIEVLKPIPPIVVLPIAVLLRGSSPEMAVILVVFALVPTLLVVVAAGVRDCDPVALDSARSYGLGPLARLRRIVVPSALPFIATQLRIAASWAVVISVTAEIVGGAPGLGSRVQTSREAGLDTNVFALVTAMGILGVALNAALRLLERRVLHWHVSVRRHSTVSQFNAGRPGLRVVEALRRAIDSRAEPLLDRVAAFKAAAAGRADDLWRSRRPRRLGPAASAWAARTPAVAQVVAPLLLIGWIDLATAHSRSPFFPPLTNILSRFQKIWLSHLFWADAVPSLRNLVVGYAVAVVVGISLGIIFARARRLGAMSEFPMNFLRSIPGVAYIPVLITLVGFTSVMRIMAIAMVAVFPVLIATADGVSSVDGQLEDVCRSYRVGRVRRTLSVDLPAAAPRIFAGLEVALAASLVVMIASELLGTSAGIGAQVLLAQQTLNFADMWAGIVLLAVIGLVATLGFRLTRHRVLRWYDGAQAANKKG